MQTWDTVQRVRESALGRSQACRSECWDWAEEPGALPEGVLFTLRPTAF